MKKAEKRMSWKEVFQMNIRGLKLFMSVILKW